jgi:hypothetical protein
MESPTPRERDIQLLPPMLTLGLLITLIQSSSIYAGDLWIENAFDFMIIYFPPTREFAGEKFTGI